jgi:hypothetical protein
VAFSCVTEVSKVHWLWVKHAPGGNSWSYVTWLRQSCLQLCHNLSFTPSPRSHHIGTRNGQLRNYYKRTKYAYYEILFYITFSPTYFCSHRNIMQNNQVYLLPNIRIQLFYNSDTMHWKFRIIRFEITVFRVMGLCSLTGGYRGFGQDILPPSSDCLWRQVQNAPPRHSWACTRQHGVLTQTALWILTSEHLKSSTKEYKEQVKRGHKHHVGKTELQQV